MLYFKTAGEPYGRCLIALVEGFPAGVVIDEAVINNDLKRRQGGIGRGGRMQIEEDRVEILSGVRRKVTLGGPLCLMVKNSDYKIDELLSRHQTSSRPCRPCGRHQVPPGGCARDLERASARETGCAGGCGRRGKNPARSFWDRGVWLRERGGRY